jgi:hypothetical protein
MKIGDLVKVVSTGACGGLSTGALGLILEEDNSQRTAPRWTIMWISGNEVMHGHRMKESVTYGHGVEVVGRS